MPRTVTYMRPKRRCGGSGPASDRPSVAVSHTKLPTEDASVYNLEGGLRVTVERDWQLEVPCAFTFDAPKRFSIAQNPINQCGPVLAEQVPVVTTNDFDSLMAAFNKRCNTVHKDDILDHEYNAAMRVLRSIDLQFPAWDDNDLDRDRWEAKFDSSKRERMQKAVHSFSTANSAYLGTKDLSVKLEVLLKRNDPEFAPRVIYAGNDVFNALTGPAMMVAMERLEVVFKKQSFGPVKYCTAYKKNDVELATFISDKTHLYPHTVEGDYSANDKHQRKRVHYLFDTYLEMINMPMWLRRTFLEMNKFTVQSRQYGFSKGKLENQLPTGTTATTVRNTVYNALMFSVSCIEQDVSGVALVLGDDLLANTDKPINLDQWAATVSRFRMVLKPKAPKLNGGATFLSRRLITNREQPCMVPLIGKAIARFNARAIYTEGKTSSQYMAGKSLSYAYEFRHVPFLRDNFLLRYTMEDNSALTLDELTWNTKTSGIDLSNIVQAIKDEKVLVDDDEFLEWAMETYGLGLVDLDEILEMVILSDEIEMVTHPSVANLAIDW